MHLRQPLQLPKGRELRVLIHDRFSTEGRASIRSGPASSRTGGHGGGRAAGCRARGHASKELDLTKDHIQNCARITKLMEEAGLPEPYHRLTEKPGHVPQWCSKHWLKAGDLKGLQAEDVRAALAYAAEAVRERELPLRPRAAGPARRHARGLGAGGRVGPHADDGAEQWTRSQPLRLHDGARWRRRPRRDRHVYKPPRAEDRTPPPPCSPGRTAGFRPDYPFLRYNSNHGGD